MKLAKIFSVIGYAALFLASLFQLINSIAERILFGRAVTLPLYFAALVGIFCGIAISTVKKGK